ncbi:MAG: hypothetical protein ACRC20_17125 [Segniliparus sp.]|uniref:hypothetical protein n=1 Tax=Segniliparus sp. TaxID=2804064 RepID=UPI003F3D0444
MSGEREPNRPPVLVRFAVGALAKSYEDIRSWTDQVRDDISRLPDEIKKIPVNLASLPVQAVTDAVSSAIRLQQNFNALVIKGDETLDLIFHKPEEKPAWATFDEDEDDELPPLEAPETKRVAPVARLEPATAGEPTSAAPASKPPVRAVRATTKPSAAKPAAPKPPVSKPRTEKPAASKPPAPKAEAPVKAAPPKAVTPAKPAVVKPAPKQAAAKSATKKPAAAKPVAPKAEAPVKAAPKAEAAPKPAAAKPAAPVAAAQGNRPELVDYLEYETLSLAQLRARARNLSVPELRELLAFERANGNRPPFITLLENRITTSGA